MDEPAIGKIIMSDFIDPQGQYAGPHPALIICTSSTHEAGAPILVVVISTKPQYSAKDDAIRLPTKKGGHPVTGLNKHGHLICTWGSLLASVYGTELSEAIARIKAVFSENRLVLTERPASYKSRRRTTG